jgi:hypothetical protein
VIKNHSIEKNNQPKQGINLNTSCAMLSYLLLLLCELLTPFLICDFIEYDDPLLPTPTIIIGF